MEKIRAALINPLGLVRKQSTALRTAEFVLLFIGLPLLYSQGAIPIPCLPLLLIITALCCALLLADSRFRKKRSPLRGAMGHAKSIMIRFGGSAILLYVFLASLTPAALAGTPQHGTEKWMQALVLYPVLSVCPQEIVYRTFFFHRYRSLFGSEQDMRAANAFAFSFLHIIYGNLPAVLLSLCGGYLFARTYQRTGSVVMTSIEHALYGCFLFLIGLDKFFIRGIQV